MNNNETSLQQRESGAGAHGALRSSLLAIAVVALPACLAYLAVTGCRSLSGRPDVSPATFETVDPSSLDLNTSEGLLRLRDQLRHQGKSITGINRQIWAIQSHDPVALFSVQPPVKSGSSWRWMITKDGRYAVASAGDSDAAGRRETGLYDLVEENWCWKSRLPWPDDHESPFVVDGRVMMAYTRNGRRFMLRIRQDGEIEDIVQLPVGRAGSLYRGILSNPMDAVVINQIRFQIGSDGRLTGKAVIPLPGLQIGEKMLEAFNLKNPGVDETVQNSYADWLDNLKRSAESRDPEEMLSVSYLALRAYLFVANQSWLYATQYMLQMAKRQENDHRAPRVNLLLLARCAYLAGQNNLVYNACQLGLDELYMDTSDENAWVKDEYRRIMRLLEQQGGIR